MRTGHFNPHGTRKGAAVCASSGTTLPASLAAIANRGEWTISMMFEVYLGFAEPGDQYLGRLLAGLLPNSSEFGVIPPHFICGMENKFVAEAMNTCFRGILDDKRKDGNGVLLRSNTKAMLLRCLACMVHHSDGLLKIIEENPGHVLGSIPILSNKHLRYELKKLITSEPSERIRMATGIPPHVEAMTMIKSLTSLVRQERDERLQHYEEIKSVIADKIEQVAEENGQITRPLVLKMFGDFQTTVESSISSKIEALLEAIDNRSTFGKNRNIESHASKESDFSANSGYDLWSYEGKFWNVPKDFDLPKKVQRRRGWELWVKGMHTADGKKICAFRFFSSSNLPKPVYRKFKVEWQPIMKKMESAPGVELPINTGDVTQDILDATFTLATDHLRDNVCSFLFNDKKKRIESWTVGSWSSCTQRSFILKNGSESDIANLPEEKRENRPHTKKRTVKKKKNTITNTTASAHTTASAVPIQPIPIETQTTAPTVAKPSGTQPVAPQQPVLEILAPTMTSTATPRTTPYHNLMNNSKPPKKLPPPPPSNNSNVQRRTVRKRALTPKAQEQQNVLKSKRKRSDKGKNMERNTKKDAQQTNAAFAAAFAAVKSPHHDCSYAKCHFSDHMFYQLASEKCNKCKSSELHHACMVTYGSETYGEAAEGIGMSKICKSCFDSTAKNKNIKKV